jgi:hypothetical protein
MTPAPVPSDDEGRYEPRVSPIIGLGRTGWGGGGGDDVGFVDMLTFYDWLISTITSAISKSAPARNATISQRSWRRFNAALRPM